MRRKLRASVTNTQRKWVSQCQTSRTGNPFAADNTPINDKPVTKVVDGVSRQDWAGLYDKTGNLVGSHAARAAQNGDVSAANLMAAGPVNAGILATLDPDMVATWAAEGGVAENLHRAKVTAGRIDKALGESAETISMLARDLPDALRNKMIDAMRLNPGRGSIESQIKKFEDGLSDEEFSRWAEFADNLTPEQAQAIKTALKSRK